MGSIFSLCDQRKRVQHFFFCLKEKSISWEPTDFMYYGLSGTCLQEQLMLGDCFSKVRGFASLTRAQALCFCSYQAHQLLVFITVIFALRLMVKQWLGFPSLLS